MNNDPSELLKIALRAYIHESHEPSVDDRKLAQNGFELLLADVLEACRQYSLNFDAAALRGQAIWEEREELGYVWPWFWDRPTHEPQKD